METPARDDSGLVANFDPTQPSGMVQNNRLWPRNTAFLPRLGFAWDVTGSGKTTLRSSVGLAMAVPNLQAWITSQFTDLSAMPTGGTLFFADGSTIQGPGNINNILETLAPVSSGGVIKSNPLPWSAGSPLFNTNVFQCGNGLAVTGSTTVFNPKPCIGYGANPDIKFPRMATWNLNIQHAFTNNLSLDLGYVGSHAWDIAGLEDLNQPVPGVASSSAEQARRPYFNQFPWFSNITYVTDLGGTNYASLQAALNQRFSHGLTYSLGYTLSHAVGIQSGPGAGTGPVLNLACPRCEYGNQNLDVLHHFSLTASYDIPGRKAPGQMLEGWAINSSVNVMSPLPLNILDSSLDTSGTGEKIVTAHSTPALEVPRIREQTWEILRPLVKPLRHRMSSRAIPSWVAAVLAKSSWD
jgi:hypothetical protein